MHAVPSGVHIHAQRVPVYEQSSMTRYTSKSGVVNKNLPSILKERFCGENHSMKNGGTTSMLWTHFSFCHVYKLVCSAEQRPTNGMVTHIIMQ